jgi:hypothetical protein
VGASGWLQRLDDSVGAGPRLPPRWTAADRPLVRIDEQLGRIAGVAGATAALLLVLAELAPERTRWPIVVVVFLSVLVSQLVLLSVAQRPDSATSPARQVSATVPTRPPATRPLLVGGAALVVAAVATLLIGAGAGWIAAAGGGVLGAAMAGLLHRARLRRWQARAGRVALVRVGRFGLARSGCYTRPAR